MKKLEIRIAIAAMAALAGVSGTNRALALVPEHEVDVGPISGPVAVTYGDHTVNAALSTALEVDTYTFAGQGGDSIRILARSLSGIVDPVITLRDPTNAVLATAVCEGSQGCTSIVLDRALTASGVYTVNIADNGANESGTYQLGLERYPPVNNWVGFGYTTPVDDTLQYPIDMDFHAFTGVAGTTVRLSAASLSGTVDPVVAVWDPTGVLVANFVCEGSQGCTTSFVDIAIARNGAYRVSIADNGLNEVGNYRLAVNCLFGACPLPGEPPPVPVPEPATWAMALGGIAALGLRRFLNKR